MARHRVRSLCSSDMLLVVVWYFYRRFGTTYRSHIRRSSSPKRILLVLPTYAEQHSWTAQTPLAPLRKLEFTNNVSGFETYVHHQSQIMGGYLTMMWHNVQNYCACYAVQRTRTMDKVRINGQTCLIRRGWCVLWLARRMRDTHRKTYITPNCLHFYPLNTVKNYYSWKLLIFQ